MFENNISVRPIRPIWNSNRYRIIKRDNVPVTVRDSRVIKQLFFYRLHRRKGGKCTWLNRVWNSRRCTNAVFIVWSHRSYEVPSRLRYCKLVPRVMKRETNTKRSTNNNAGAGRWPFWCYANCRKSCNFERFNIETRYPLWEWLTGLEGSEWNPFRRYKNTVIIVHRSPECRTYK